MNAITTALVVSAVVLSAVRLARCQADRVDNKYLDPNDYFLAGGDQQERRRVQDAFNRYLTVNVLALLIAGRPNLTFIQATLAPNYGLCKTYG